MLSAVLLGEVEEGEVARVTGVVRAASRTLRSKLRGTSCVYWDVRAGLAKEPEASEACAFWIEDASGTRALVRSEALRVDVRAQRAQELVETAESDIAAVSESIRALKDRARTTQGPAQGELNRERRHLAKVATVLCAIRAEARENVHVGGTLAGQRKWIEKNLHFANEGGGKLRTIQMRVERFEVVLCDGDPVEIEGRLRREPMPGELGGGYRDRSDCWVVTPGPEDVVVVRGVGRAAPASEAEVRGPFAGLHGGLVAPQKPRVDPILVWTGVLVGLAVALALLLR